jgi:hypothetical protein
MLVFRLIRVNETRRTSPAESIRPGTFFPQGARARQIFYYYYHVLSDRLTLLDYSFYAVVSEKVPVDGKRPSYHYLPMHYVQTAMFIFRREHGCRCVSYPVTYMYGPNRGMNTS